MRSHSRYRLPLSATCLLALFLIMVVVALSVESKTTGRPNKRINRVRRGRFRLHRQNFRTVAKKMTTKCTSKVKNVCNRMAKICHIPVLTKRSTLYQRRPHLVSARHKKIYRVSRKNRNGKKPRRKKYKIKIKCSVCEKYCW